MVTEELNERKSKIEVFNIAKVIYYIILCVPNWKRCIGVWVFTSCAFTIIAT